MSDHYYRLKNVQTFIRRPFAVFTICRHHWYSVQTHDISKKLNKSSMRFKISKNKHLTCSQSCEAHFASDSIQRSEFPNYQYYFQNQIDTNSTSIHKKVKYHKEKCSYFSSSHWDAVYQLYNECTKLNH
ncbi:Hypothetical_protein [Hexamita inflata]|uniref:Hypothetical_protein n=1 Tax=Hexamita inflata TaxID=28002 RepID=A0ABP1HIP9_9EUKA